MQSCVLKVISVVFYCLFLNYLGMTMVTNYTLILQNSFVVHSFVIFCSFTSMSMRSLKSNLSVNCLSILVNGDIVK